MGARTTSPTTWLKNIGQSFNRLFATAPTERRSDGTVVGAFHFCALLLNSLEESLQLWN